MSCWYYTIAEITPKTIFHSVRSKVHFKGRFLDFFNNDTIQYR